MILQLDFSSDIPIYMQIRNQIIMGIANGSLAAGEKLPTIRSLADEAGINMMTVNKAYQLLKQEGYITADRRSGAVVIGNSSMKNELSEKTRSDFRLLVSEAKLTGMTRDDLLLLCGSLYDNLEAEEKK